jgi:hypothetical protein
MSVSTGPRAEKETCSTTAKHKVVEFLDTKHYQVFLFVATIYTLFADDSRELAGKKDGDAAVYGLMFFCLVVFALELIVMSWAMPKYVLGLYFWLDFVAIASIIPDIPWLAEVFLGIFGENSDSMQNHEVDRASRATSVATRAGRLARLIRLIRLVRVIRAVRIFGFLFKKKKKEGDDSNSKRRGISNIQDKMFTTVVESISKRVVIVVLMVIFASFACQDFSQDFSRVEGLLSLDDFSIDFKPTDSSVYQDSYKKSYNQSIQTYIEQQPRLMFLSLNGVDVFPTSTVPGFCCVNPGGSPTNTDYLRTFELMKYTIQSADRPGQVSSAFFDIKNERQTEAKWQLILLLLVIIILVASSFDFSHVSIQLIRQPVEHLVVADQTMGALLEVFKAVTNENDTADETMNTITGACCKALDAERTNLWIMDPMKNRLDCRYQAQMDLDSVLETEGESSDAASLLEANQQMLEDEEEEDDFQPHKNATVSFGKFKVS